MSMRISFSRYLAIGLSGAMTINTVDGKHLFDFEYKIADAGE
jgi:hypothetical protein